MEPAIKSILDTDTYTFSLQNAILELFPDAIAEYRFFNRGKHAFTKALVDELTFQINEVFPSFALTQDEYKWFKDKCKYLKPWYFEYLKNYRFNPKEVTITQDSDFSLKVRGPWHSTICWEVPLLATSSDLYFKMVDKNWSMAGQVEKINQKATILSDNNCKVSDMSTRRRRDFETQDMVVREMKKHRCFVGTSNPYLAMKYDVTPIGTMSHQWTQAMQALESIRHCNYYAMHNWIRVFGTSLGTMLTDTVTTDCFLKDFNSRFSNLFSGTRNDSGNEFEYVDKLVKHYSGFKIQPLSKSIIFSNSLNVTKAVAIRKYCDGKINAAFGMGNHLGNDFMNSPSPNMVIKLWAMNDIPTCKLSDDIGKITGDKDVVRVTQWCCTGKPLD